MRLQASTIFTLTRDLNMLPICLQPVFIFFNMSLPCSCRDLSRAYLTTIPEEENYWMQVEGTLPAELTSTYLRC